MIRVITLDFGNTLVPVSAEGLRGVVVHTATAMASGLGPFDVDDVLRAWGEERERGFQERSLPEVERDERDDRSRDGGARVRVAAEVPREGVRREESRCAGRPEAEDGEARVRGSAAGDEERGCRDRDEGVGEAGRREHDDDERESVGQVAYPLDVPHRLRAGREIELDAVDRERCGKFVHRSRRPCYDAFVVAVDRGK